MMRTGQLPAFGLIFADKSVTEQHGEIVMKNTYNKSVVVLTNRQITEILMFPKMKQYPRPENSNTLT